MYKLIRPYLTQAMGLLYLSSDCVIVLIHRWGNQIVEQY